MSEITERELREVLDSLTIREVLLVIRLYELIMQRLRVHVLKHTSSRSLRSANDIIEYIVEQMVKQQQLPQVAGESEIDSERIKQFIEKLRAVIQKNEEREKT
ncbi:MAG: hypothetical protein QXK07_07125 [Desulfurococcaceae archaeon]